MARQLSEQEVKAIFNEIYQDLTGKFVIRLKTIEQGNYQNYPLFKRLILQNDKFSHDTQHILIAACLFTIPSTKGQHKLKALPDIHLIERTFKLKAKQRNAIKTLTGVFRKILEPNLEEGKKKSISQSVDLLALKLALDRLPFSNEEKKEFYKILDDILLCFGITKKQKISEKMLAATKGVPPELGKILLRLKKAGPDEQITYEWLKVPEEKEYKKELEITQGYLPRTKMVNVSNTHAMDVGNYVAKRIPLTVIEDIKENNKKIEFHDTERQNILSRLSADGYDKVLWIKTADGKSKDLYLAAKPDGKYKYVITNFTGFDKYIHIQLHTLLTGVLGSKVTSYVYHDLGEWIDTYSKVGFPKTDIVIIGQKRPIIDSMPIRIKTRERIKRFQTYLQAAFPEIFNKREPKSYHIFDLAHIMTELFKPFLIPVEEYEKTLNVAHMNQEKIDETLSNYREILPERNKLVAYMIEQAKIFTGTYKLDQRGTIYNNLLFGDPEFVFHNGIYAALLMELFNKLEAFNTSISKGFNNLVLTEKRLNNATEFSFSEENTIRKLINTAFNKASFFNNVFDSTYLQWEKNLNLAENQKTDLVDTSIIRVKIEDEEKTVLLTNYPFGETSKYFVLSLLKNEPEYLIFLGNCGAIAESHDENGRNEPTINLGAKVRKADLVLPVKVYDQLGNLINQSIKNEMIDIVAPRQMLLPFRNKAPKVKNDIFFSKNNVHLTKHVKVESPLFETQNLLQSWMENSFGTVEVEVSEILYAINMTRDIYRPPHLGILLHVSDIPLCESLEKTDIYKELGWAKEKSIDYTFKLLKIQDIYEKSSKIPAADAVLKLQESRDSRNQLDLPFEERRMA